MPLGSTITNATLSVYVTDADSNDFIDLHRMNATWSEASTWNSLTNGIQIDGAEASLVSSATIDAGTSGWVTFTNLTATVQDWINGQPNFGWALFSNGADDWTFHSSEASNVNLRPYLSVSYTSPQLPQIDLDANNSSGSPGANFRTTFTENGGAILVADVDASLTDADSTNLTSLTATITNLLDGTDESLSANTTGTSITASYDSGTGVLTLSGTDTVANYQQVLRTIRYNNTSEDPTTTSRTIDFVASDAFVSGLTATTTVEILAVNDAPVLDNSGAPALPTITEDEINNSGMTVADLLATGASGNPITDIDGDPEGIAIVNRNNGRGIWEYSLDGGTNWSVVGTVSETEALLLRATDVVRFAPDGQNGNPTDRDFEFRAWDQSSGVAGTKVDVTTNGGSTAFSSTTEIASITTTDVNDAPVLDNSAALTLTTQTEDAGPPVGAVGTVITNLVSIGGNVTDVDAGSQTGVAITATDTTNGTWWYTLDGGTNWNAMGSVSDASARVLNANSNTRIYFESNADFNGTISDAITFRAWDRLVGPSGSLHDTTTNGGTTAFSSATETADLTITAVNDAPELDLDANDSSAAGNDFTVTFIEQGGPVTIVDGDVALSDVDNLNLNQIVVTLTNELESGNKESLSASTAGTSLTAVWDNAANTLTISGVGTVADFLTVLQTVQYDNTSNNPDTTDRIVTFVANDGTDSSLTATTTISFSTVNDAPTITAIGNQPIDEDTAIGALAFTIGDAETAAA